MAYAEKLNVLEIMNNLLKEHEKKLDQLLLKIEIVDSTIKQDPRLNKSLHEYDPDVHSFSQNILVVDDDEKLANTFKLILEGVGYRVDTANLGQEAINLAETYQYDLLLIDVNLPDMLGNEVAEKVKEINRFTDVVFITGYSMLKDNIETSVEDEVLMKPIGLDYLIEFTKKKLENKVEALL
jgi:CheY-like chemotaxis protein